MGWNDHVDFELSERIDALIELGYFDNASPAALGIAKQVSGQGEGSLSDKQRYIYENEVIGVLKSAPPDDKL